MRRWWASSLMLALVLVLSLAGAAQAQDKALYWQRYDVDITVQKSGDIRVIETQELVFTSGTFRYGQREIYLNRLGGISDVTVSEEGGQTYVLSSSGDPYTYSVQESGSYLNVRYNFPPSTDTRRTIVIGYTVSEALRYYPDNGVDQLDWKAIPSGNPFPTQSAKITLHLPEGATFTNYGTYGVQGTADFASGQRDATIQIDERIDAGQEVEVVAEWQHGVIAGAPADWQQELDVQAEQQATQEAFQAKWGSVFDLGFSALGLLFAVGGSVLVYLWWHRRGRDVPVGMIADYLPEPPSDLPPGVVGTLVDESADMQDILSTILDLARRGVLEIEEVQEPGFLGIGHNDDFVYRRKSNSVALRPYEASLIDKMFGKHESVELSELKNKFYKHIPTLRKQLYEEVVTEGFFVESPESTRTRFGCLGVGALVAAVVGGIALAAMLSQYSGAVVCLPIGLGVAALALAIASRYMPRRTEKGADAAARWKAFKRYLENIEKYSKVEEATGIFERYLPYAVAFGLEQSWIDRFSRVDTPAPTWWIPYGYERPFARGGFGGADSGSAGGRVPGHAAPVSREGGAPSLEGMSKGMGSSLSGMSAGLGAMLSSAGRTLTSQPSSSGGGGFSGGGFSGGGGGGSSFG